MIKDHEVSFGWTCYNKSQEIKKNFVCENACSCFHIIDEKCVQDIFSESPLNMDTQLIQTV